MIPITIMPYDEAELYSELSALLAAAPVELRGLNLHDPFTFAGGNSQMLDDGLADFTEIYGDAEAEFDCEDFGP